MARSNLYITLACMTGCGHVDKAQVMSRIPARKALEKTSQYRCLENFLLIWPVAFHKTESSVRLRDRSRMEGRRTTATRAGEGHKANLEKSRRLSGHRVPSNRIGFGQKQKPFHCRRRVAYRCRTLISSVLRSQMEWLRGKFESPTT